MLRFGPATGPVVVVALPLFEEANRTRAFAVTICRALAKRGVASVLPDLPGQGESETPLESLSILDLQTAYDALITVPDSEGRRSYCWTP
jgi:alpha-beta hydrolase superfamily lysophospholipase